MNWAGQVWFVRKQHKFVIKTPKISLVIQFERGVGYLKPYAARGVRGVRTNDVQGEMQFVEKQSG